MYSHKPDDSAQLNIDVAHHYMLPAQKSVLVCKCVVIVVIVVFICNGCALLLWALFFGRF